MSFGKSHPRLHHPPVRLNLMSCNLTRRSLLRSSVGTASYLVLGGRLVLTPAEAVELEFIPEVLTRGELELIEAVAEQLVPGSVEAGISAYLDAQLQAGNDSLLIGKYLGVDIPAQVEFYQLLARNLQEALKADRSASEVLAAMWSDKVSNWEGPPASYMLFVLRADALDVTYGTPAGFEKLGIPYMAQNMPATPW